MPQLRHIVMGLALVLTVAASVLDWPGQSAPENDHASADVAATRTDASAAPAPRERVSEAAPAANAAERMRHTKANAFAAQSWLPPVVKAKAPPPPPPPRAPPLPFVYIGKMQDGAAVTAFVSQGGRNHVLHAGDKLPSYQVESITPKDITFVYLPLNEKQRLIFGSEN